jgi:hypothetical protein
LCALNEVVFLTNNRAGIRNETTDEHRLTRIFAVFLTGFQDLGARKFLPWGAPASRRLRTASCRTRVFAKDQAIYQQMMPFRHGNFSPGSACVPQAAFGILPDAGFRE